MSKLAKKILRKITRLMNAGTIPIADNGFWQFRYPPTKSLNKAAALFDEIHGETIIEIGTGIHGKMSGNSMLVWPKKNSRKTDNRDRSGTKTDR